MATLIILVLTPLLQIGSSQRQLVTQYLNPSQATSMTIPGQAGAQGMLGGSASPLGQILINLFNYKLQWLNQLAGHLTGNSANSINPNVLNLPGGHHPGGFPFMTTLVTTLSGNSPTAPGIHISGAPVNHLPGYPGAPTPPPPPQDFHWIPVMAGGPQPPPPTLSNQPLYLPPPFNGPSQALAPLPPALGPGQPSADIPPVDFSPIETISVQAPVLAAPPDATAAIAAPAAQTTTKPKRKS